MIEAFLFDLDGTLLDTEVLWCEATRLALAERGHNISGEEALDLVYGKAWGDIRERVLRTHPDAFPTAGSLEAATERHFRDLQATRDVRIASSIDLLIRLGKEHPVAIVSGSTRSTIAWSIDLMGIGPYVRLYLGTEDYSPGKPDPGCFLIAAERLGVAPSACLVFEDSAAGIRAAKAAGMACVALQRPGHPVQDARLADEVLADLADFRLEKYRHR
ncbi:MAG: HAD family phosphatase [Planctomycetes bacterium]|nr:HAD family phosphatase [Planctomycetota bacterium]